MILLDFQHIDKRFSPLNCYCCYCYCRWWCWCCLYADNSRERRVKREERRAAKDSQRLGHEGHAHSIRPEVFSHRNALEFDMKSWTNKKKTLL